MIAALALAATLWTPSEIAATQRAIDVALQAPTLRGAHVGVLAVDAADGTILYARNENEAFVPASTFKLLAGSVALDRLGPAFTFVTQLDASANALVLIGGGDAQLSGNDLGEAAAAVTASGARHFDTLLGDATRYAAPRYPGGWSIDDIPYDYAAVPSALSLEENSINATIAPGEATGDAATISTSPASGAFSIENRVVTGARGTDDTTDVARPWDRPMTISFLGSAPLGAGAVQLAASFPDPPAAALFMLRSALASRGVTIASIAQGQAPAGATSTLWKHASHPLSRILADCWQPSDNLLAEQMLLELGAGKAGDTRENGIAVERDWLRSIGVDPANATIADGSGLSEYDRIAPATLVAILQHDWDGTQRGVVLDALPLAGVRGTLQSSFKGTLLAGSLYAKTGSMNHTRTLAGYLLTKTHGTVVFALLVNDWMDTTPAAAAAMDLARASALEALDR